MDAIARVDGIAGGKYQARKTWSGALNCYEAAIADKTLRVVRIAGGPFDSN